MDTFLEDFSVSVRRQVVFELVFMLMKMMGEGDGTGETWRLA
jgi:hypothetical protein